jgi:hypothetical protein
MANINFRRVLIASSLASLILSYSLLWWRAINNPVEFTGSDFITYYTIGSIGRQYGLDRVYDFELQKAVEERVVGFEVAPENVLPHNHLPFLNPVLVLLVIATNGNYILGFIVWNIILIGLYLTSVFIILNTETVTIERSTLNIASFMLFFPNFVSLLNGQDTALLVLGAAALFFGVLNRKEWAAGLGLALMTVRPHIALLLAIPFLFKERKVWWWFCAGALVLVLISIIPLGLTGLRDFYNIMLDTALKSRETAMINFIGLGRRLAPTIDPSIIRGIGWFLFFTAMIVLSVAWKLSNKLDGQLLGLAILAGLFFAPHLVYHDLAILIFPLMVSLSIWFERKSIQQEHIPLALLVISVILLLSFAWEVTMFIFPYLLMGILTIVLLNKKQISSHP